MKKHAKSPLDLMCKTPNGGWIARTGCEQEFEELPCQMTSNVRKEWDTYYFEDGTKLRIEWDGEEFFKV